MSMNSIDYGVGERIYSLFERQKRKCFFAPISLQDGGNTEFGAEIDLALDKSTSMIVVASTPEVFDKPYFDQEWRTWVNEKRSGRKIGNLMTAIGNAMTVAQLPLALRMFETAQIEQLGKSEILAYF